jgi:GNAT superfamily N-acetyltransferase
MKNCSIEEVKRDERHVFEIWHDRFAKEYNRSQQARMDRVLCMGTPENHWNQWFEYGTVPLWIKYGKRNIGFVAPLQLTLGLSAETAQPVQVVSDVYVDPKFRGHGLLRACLLEQRESGRKAILIDKQKLLDNAGYYCSLGFRYAMHWREQELVLVSPEKLVADELWINLLPE